MCCVFFRMKTPETRATEIWSSTSATRTTLRGRRWASTASTETASAQPPTAAEATGLHRTCRRRRGRRRRSSTRTVSLVTSRELRAANPRPPTGNRTASLLLLVLPIRPGSLGPERCRPSDTLRTRMGARHQDLFLDSLPGHPW